MSLKGIEKCAWHVGKENQVKNNLDGNCKNCKYNLTVGVHDVCIASVYLCKHIITMDCLRTSIHSKTDPDKWCFRCHYYVNPKTIRCSECLKTEELVNFKEREWKENPWIKETIKALQKELHDMKNKS